VVQKLLFIGSDLLLGGYLAAESLLTPSNSACLLLSSKNAFLENEIQQFVWEILRENLQQDAIQAAYSNFTVSVAESDEPQKLAAIIGGYGAQQVWAADFGMIRPRNDSLNLLLPFLRGSSFNYFNYVTQSTVLEGHAEASLLAQLQSNRIPFRLFHIPLVAGEYLSSQKPTGHAFLLFLAELEQLKREIKERYPGYFEYQSLRCCSPGNAYVNLVHIREAASKMMEIASNPASAPGQHIITGHENVAFTQLCEWIGIAYDLNLMNVEDPDELNAIDKLFAERTYAFKQSLVLSSERAIPSKNDLDCLESRFLDEKSAIHELKKIQRQQSAAIDQKLARAADLIIHLERKTAAVVEGELTYFITGSQGTPVVMINALGQGLRYWTRLMSELAQHHRVIIWEPRGTASTLRPFSLSDQVNDLDAILSHEGFENCHLMAWCTGPKVAIEFYLRRPEAVASMVLLNGAYKCATTSKMLTSEYENNLEGLFRALDGCPAMAPIIRKSLLQIGNDSEIPSPAEMDGKELARRVLSLKSRDLQTEILKPFESEASTLNYARQILDFYSCDIGLKATTIKVPVLLIGAEYDQIASPEYSRQLAGSMPLARYVQLSGATHYCLYEQSGTVLALVQDFFNELEESGKTPPAQQPAYAERFFKRA
jgi:pimeloyl-ACP methyl ester carboxylesterase